MRFVLTINLGNEAMRAQDDIARKLIEIGKSLRTWEATRLPTSQDNGPIHDDNGNRVGGWHVDGE